MLKDSVAVEKDNVLDANAQITSLKKKNAKMANKVLVDEELSPQVTAMDARKLTKLLESSQKDNNKLNQDVEKLKKMNNNLESKMAVLRVTAASNREDPTVLKLELKK